MCGLSLYEYNLLYIIYTIDTSSLNGITPNVAFTYTKYHNKLLTKAFSKNVQHPLWLAFNKYIITCYIINVPAGSYIFCYLSQLTTSVVFLRFRCTIFKLSNSYVEKGYSILIALFVLKGITFQLNMSIAIQTIFYRLITQYNFSTAMCYIRRDGV